MKIAILTIAYNEDEYIAPCIKQWKEYNLHHLILISAKPWNGEPVEKDRTEEIARNLGVEVVVQDWRTEKEQRNWGLARLYDYDFVLIVDANEFYTEQDRKIILEYLHSKSNEPCFRAEKVITYWKTPEYILDPPDTHKPLIAVNPKKIKIYEVREPMNVLDTRPWDYQPIIPVSIHHFSWVRSDKKVKEKIKQWSHSDIVKDNWYENVWLKWKPEMNDIRPYGIEKSRAIKKSAPQEIINLIKGQI